jgi:hypothetical protein
LSATAPPLKLTIELVPKTCWYTNLRTQIGSSDWDRISKETRVSGVCAICGATDLRLSCHERWEYDDGHGIQRLRGFVALCDACHGVKHIGRIGRLATEDPRLAHLLEDTIEHFMRVNGVDRQTFDAHKAEAFAVWRQRGAQQWTTELGEYAHLVKPSLPKKSAPRTRGNN